MVPTVPLLSWADLYKSCTFEAKQMIVCQLIKAVHVGRGYTVSVDLNVSFEALQSFSLANPEPIVMPTAM